MMKSFTRIIEQINVVDVEALAKNYEQSVHPFIAPCCTVKKGGYVAVDFGTEICGRLHVLFAVNEGGAVRIRLGESVAEAYAELGENNAGNNHSLRDCVYPVVSLSDFSTTESGFRFARIDAVEGDVRIIKIFAEASDNDLQIRGSFRCSDDKLNKIFDTAARTISLCVRKDEIWDGVKRDRLVWIGDFYPELLGAYALYGNIPQFTKVLDLVKQFDEAWVNLIPAYSAWWLICLEKYFRLTADKRYVYENLQYVHKILRQFDGIVKQNGEVSYDESTLRIFQGNEFFIDWPTNFTEDSKTGWRYLLILAMNKTKDLLAQFDEDFSVAESVKSRLDGWHYKPSTFKQVTALGVLADKIGKDEACALLKKGGAQGMTAFMGCVIVEALEKIGEGDFALQLIEEYYGKMLDFGATTFWEDFDVDWTKDNPSAIDALPVPDRKNIHADYGKFCYTGLRHSLCHGWSSGFIDFFYGYVLGIKSQDDAYKTVSVTPHLCGLSYVQGTLPTVYGDIFVSHKVVDGKVESVVKLPEGVTQI